MFLFATCVYLRGNLRVRLTTQRKFLRKFNLRPLAGPFDQGLTQLVYSIDNVTLFIQDTCSERIQVSIHQKYEE